MKVGAWWLAVAAAVAALQNPAPAPASGWVILIGGDTQGYLSPCGCTKPMSGGVRRRAALTKSLSAEGKTLVLELGPFIDEPDRQGELKSDAIAQIWRNMGVDAALLTGQDAALGVPQLDALQRLSGGRLFTSAAIPQGNVGWNAFAEDGPFRVAGWSGDAAAWAYRLEAEPAVEAAVIQQLLDDAEAADQMPILMLDGDEASARGFAERYPALRLIVFRDPNRATREPIVVGRTWLVSPGPKGKELIQIRASRDTLSGYTVFDLGPEIEDDETAHRLYHEYLDRVREEQLLARIPRRPPQGFAGNQACMSCHPKAYEVWKNSEHGHALATLEEDNHDADPECVGCHVVGLDAEDGFRSRDRTPQMTDVGCESCHGPAKAHVDNPRTPLPTVTEDDCRKCHTPEQSPPFAWETYWPPIAHGRE